MDFSSLMWAGRRLVAPLDVLPVGGTYLIGIPGLLPPTSTQPRVAAFVYLLVGDITTPLSQVSIQSLLVHETGLTSATMALARVDGQSLSSSGSTSFSWTSILQSHPTTTFGAISVPSMVSMAASPPLHSATSQAVPTPNLHLMPALDWEGPTDPSLPANRQTSSSQAPAPVGLVMPPFGMPSSTSSSHHHSVRLPSTSTLARGMGRPRPYPSSPRPHSSASLCTASTDVMSTPRRVHSPISPAADAHGDPMLFQAPGHDDLSPTPLLGLDELDDDAAGDEDGNDGDENESK